MVSSTSPGFIVSAWPETSEARGLEPMARRARENLRAASYSFGFLSYSFVQNFAWVSRSCRSAASRSAREAGRIGEAAASIIAFSVVVEGRSEERRVGNESHEECRSRWSR